MNPYAALLVFMILTAGLTGGVLFLAGFLGPKRDLAGRNKPYECGKEPFLLPANRKNSIQFYVLAMIFIIFDIEMIFLFPWAVLLRDLGWHGFASITLFVFLILLAYAYAWKHKALEVR